MNLKNFCQLFLIIITEFNKIVDIVLIWMNDLIEKGVEFYNH